MSITAGILILVKTSQQDTDSYKENSEKISKIITTVGTTLLLSFTSFFIYKELGKSVLLPFLALSLSIIISTIIWFNSIYQTSEDFKKSSKKAAYILISVSVVMLGYLIWKQ
jgi:hypothetical protein